MWGHSACLRVSSLSNWGILGMESGFEFWGIA